VSSWLACGEGNVLVSAAPGVESALSAVELVGVIFIACHDSHRRVVQIGTVEQYARAIARQGTTPNRTFARA
jgi:hypothetical protein